MDGLEYTFVPIGVVRGGGDFPQQAPRQSVYARNEGFVELFPHRNFEQALEDLSGFARIWLIFVFDRNHTWKPKVFPPFGADRKVGVFASRAPYRPNPIGISAVELVKIEGLKVHIRNFDLLDGTPVLDIKPYISEADSFPGSPAGWRDAVPRHRGFFSRTRRRPSSKSSVPRAGPTWPTWRGSSSPCTPLTPNVSGCRKRRKGNISSLTGPGASPL